jgi:hypothetical protein
MEAKNTGISKLKVISDGTSMGTKVFLDGKEIIGIINKIAWVITASGGLAEARVTFNNVEAEVVGTTVIQTIKAKGYRDSFED